MGSIPYRGIVILSSAICPISKLNHQYSFVPVNYKDYYTFKYVHELKSVNVRVYGEYAEAQFLALKLEYKGSSWHEAGEPRTVIFHLTGHAWGAMINELNNVNGLILGDKSIKD